MPRKALIATTIEELCSEDEDDEEWHDGKAFMFIERPDLDDDEEADGPAPADFNAHPPLPEQILMQDAPVEMRCFVGFVDHSHDNTMRMLGHPPWITSDAARHPMTRIDTPHGVPRTTLTPSVMEHARARLSPNTILPLGYPPVCTPYYYTYPDAGRSCNVYNARRLGSEPGHRLIKKTYIIDEEFFTGAAPVPCPVPLQRPRYLPIDMQGDWMDLDTRQRGGRSAANMRADGERFRRAREALRAGADIQDEDEDVRERARQDYERDDDEELYRRNAKLRKIAQDRMRARSRRFCVLIRTATPTTRPSTPAASRIRRQSR